MVGSQPTSIAECFVRTPVKLTERGAIVGCSGAMPVGAQSALPGVVGESSCTPSSGEGIAAASLPYLQPQELGCGGRVLGWCA